MRGHLSLGGLVLGLTLGSSYAANSANAQFHGYPLGGVPDAGGVRRLDAVDVTNQGAGSKMAFYGGDGGLMVALDDSNTRFMWTMCDVLFKPTVGSTDRGGPTGSTKIIGGNLISLMTLSGNSIAYQHYYRSPPANSGATTVDFFRLPNFISADADSTHVRLWPRKAVRDGTTLYIFAYLVDTVQIIRDSIIIKAAGITDPDPANWYITYIQMGNFSQNPPGSDTPLTYAFGQEAMILPGSTPSNDLLLSYGVHSPDFKNNLFNTFTVFPTLTDMTTLRNISSSVNGGYADMYNQSRTTYFVNALPASVWVNSGNGWSSFANNGFQVANCKVVGTPGTFACQSFSIRPVPGSPGTYQAVFQHDREVTTYLTTQQNNYENGRPLTPPSDDAARVYIQRSRSPYGPWNYQTATVLCKLSRMDPQSSEYSLDNHNYFVIEQPALAQPGTIGLTYTTDSISNAAAVHVSGTNPNDPRLPGWFYRQDHLDYGVSGGNYLYTISSYYPPKPAGF